jgi:glycosyltransferase involved in cell wall biosynthesis
VPERPVRVARVIARLNIGGPAIQAITLTERLRPLGYETLLVRGKEAPAEGTMDHLADRLGVAPVRVPQLRREPGLHDLRALAHVIGHLRRFNPDLVHTHAAKGGAIGRLGALALGRSGPRVRVHTFHGHVLEGYFHPIKARFFMVLERWLARHTTRLIAVSNEVKSDLVRLGIASPSKIEVIPLGFDLSRFLVPEPDREAMAEAWRARLGLRPTERVVLLVARLVPIKRVDRFLRIANLASETRDTVFVVVGDGQLRRELVASAEARLLGARLRWSGFETDIASAMFGSDLVVLTSDNEGTPVSLIEAHAAGLPAVCTDVGGVRAVVRDGVSGFVCRRDDEVSFAKALTGLLHDQERARRFGDEGRAYVTERFDIDRLVRDIDGLYRELLAAEAGTTR